jgi:hypothetical protein
MKINPYTQNNSHAEVKSEDVMSCNETTTEADKLAHSNVELNQRGQCILFSVVFTPFSPKPQRPLTTAVLGS